MKHCYCSSMFSGRLIRTLGINGVQSVCLRSSEMHSQSGEVIPLITLGFVIGDRRVYSFQTSLR